MKIVADGTLETPVYSVTATLPCWVYSLKGGKNLHVIIADLYNSELEDFSEMERAKWHSNEIFERENFTNEYLFDRSAQHLS
jgi:hypothetical protein